MTSRDGSQAISLATLKRGLSEPRLEAYRLRPDDPPRMVFGRYRFNVALCESFYHPLHLLEVLLRNTLHRSITAHYGNNAAWYDRAPAVLMPREQDEILKAKNQLRRNNKPEEPDRLVAELNFGFWTGLLAGIMAQAARERFSEDSTRCQDAEEHSEASAFDSITAKQGLPF